MPKTYLVAHVGCPTFESIELPDDAASQGLIEVVEVQDAASRSLLCESVLGDLPEPFGRGEATAAYVREVAGLTTFAVEDKGLLAVKMHGEKAAEVYVLGVRPEQQRCGVGTALLAAAESYLRAREVEYVEAKTGGPSRAQGFFEARGFVPLDQLDEVAILVKRL
jgi:ribosomal protein S18 acetylase RimI-like enzyme